MLNNKNEYKPTSVNDIVFGDERAGNLIKDIVAGTLPFPFAGVNGIILHGPNGTGKSALAHILPAAIDSFGSPVAHAVDYEFHKITIATDGKDLIEKIAYKTEFVPLDRFRYFVLDEFDNLNPKYLPSMKSVMNCETAVFIMTTNNIGKIENSIKSRSHSIYMPFADAERWLPAVKSVLIDQGVSVPSDANLCKVIAASRYDARKIMGSTLKLANDLRALGKVPQAAANSNEDAMDAA